MRKSLSRIYDGVKGLNLTDLAFLAMVLSVMAFYDLRTLAVVLQSVFLLLVGVELILKKTPLFGHRIRILYVVWYLAVFL